MKGIRRSYVGLEDDDDDHDHDHDSNNSRPCYYGSDDFYGLNRGGKGRRGNSTTTTNNNISTSRNTNHRHRHRHHHQQQQQPKKKKEQQQRLPIEQEFEFMMEDAFQQPWRGEFPSSHFLTTTPTKKEEDEEEEDHHTIATTGDSITITTLDDDGGTSSTKYMTRNYHHQQQQKQQEQQQQQQLRRPSNSSSSSSPQNDDTNKTPSSMTWKSFCTIQTTVCFLMMIILVYGAGIATGFSLLRGSSSSSSKDTTISQVVQSSSEGGGNANGNNNNPTIILPVLVTMTLSPQPLLPSQEEETTTGIVVLPTTGVVPSPTTIPQAPAPPVGLGVEVGVPPASSPTQNQVSSPTSSNNDNESEVTQNVPINSSNGNNNDTDNNNNNNNNNKEILVGAYYYPWYGNDFHRGGGYIRNQLNPPQYPTLGEYDDTNPTIIQQHFQWSRQANIGVWITSWWGPNRREDSTIRNVILPHTDLGDMKIALLYESTSRIHDDDDFASNVEPDMNYMCQHYFNHPNYLKINNRPVVVVYLTRALDREHKLENVILAMRSAADKCGHSIYVMGDHAFQKSPNPSEVFMPFLYLDAVTNYDVYGSIISLMNNTTSNYAGMTAVDKYYQEQQLWRDSAAQYQCNYIPAVSPGFNDRGVRLSVDHRALSRQLTESSEHGTLFSYSISKAKKLIDPDALNLLLVNSFNEWHEDTQIEPIASTTAEGDDVTTNYPLYLTEGVEYQGYGELYLDILREGTIGHGNIFNQ